MNGIQGLDNSEIRFRTRTWDNPDEIAEFLRQQAVCYVAVHDEPFPYVLPQTFEIELTGSNMIFLLHFAKTGRIGRLVRAHPNVTIAVSKAYTLLTGPRADESSLEYKSVVARCECSVFDGAELLERHQERVLEKYRPQRDYAPMDKAWLKPLMGVRARAVEVTAKIRYLDDPREEAGGYIRRPLGLD